MVANGQITERAKHCQTAQEMLIDFSVGTEKSKIAPAQPKDDELIPLNVMDLRSNSAQIKALLNRKKR